MATPANSIGAITKKLRGYDFYNAIGAPKRIVAPMVRTVAKRQCALRRSKRHDFMSPFTCSYLWAYGHCVLTACITLCVALCRLCRWTSRSWRFACSVASTAPTSATRPCSIAACLQKARRIERRCLSSTFTTAR